MRKLCVVMAALETLPFLQGGGLADVPPELGKALLKTHENIKLKIVFPRSEPSLNKEVGPEKFSFESEFEDKKIKVGAHEKEEDGIIFTALSGGPLDNPLYGESHNEKCFFFSKAFSEYLKKTILPRIEEDEELLVHCHDWHTGLIIPILKLDPDIKKKPACVYTIHNYFRPQFEKKILEDIGIEWLKGEGLTDPITGKINPDRSALYFSDMGNTVSLEYRNSLMSYPEISWAADKKFEGILNGATSFEENVEIMKKSWEGLTELAGGDLSRFKLNTERMRTFYKEEYDGERAEIKNDAKKLLFELLRDKKFRGGLKKKYNFEAPVPEKGTEEKILASFVGRIAFQKGLDIINTAFPEARKKIKSSLGKDISLIILGTGDCKVKKELGEKALLLEIFSKELRNLIYLASDMFLVPSRYEPCGLTPFQSMAFGGTPVVVNPVGGLKEIVDDSCGEKMRCRFYEDEYMKIGDREEAEEALKTTIFRMAEKMEVPEKKEEIIKNCLKRAREPGFSWERAAEKYYKKLYLPALSKS